MVTVPNQKIVKIVHYKKKGKEPFNIFTKTEMTTAAKLLNDRTTSYILYCYLAMNKDGYTLALSPKAIEKEIGLTETQYRKAVKRLEETGYLVKSGKSLYTFHTLPENTDNRSKKMQKTQTVPHSEIQSGLHSKIQSGLHSEIQRNITNDNIDNIINNTVKKDSSYIDDYKSKREQIIADFNNEFGYLDDAYLKIYKEVSTLDEHIKSKSNILALEKSYRKLSEKIDTMRANKKRRTNTYRTKLFRYVDKGDIYTHLIFKKYDEQHPPHRLIKNNKFIRWINGWNEELQEPNIIYAPLTIGVDILKGTKHNIEGIPKSYYLNK